jgi:hypothetical protein
LFSLHFSGSDQEAKFRVHLLSGDRDLIGLLFSFLLDKMHHLLHLIGDIGVIHLALDKLSKLTKQNKILSHSHTTRKKRKKNKKILCTQTRRLRTKSSSHGNKEENNDVLLPQRISKIRTNKLISSLCPLSAAPGRYTKECT